MFRNIDHVGVVVADISSAAKWYEKKLGWTVRHKEFVIDVGAHLAFMLPDDLGIDGSAAAIQLVQPVEPGPVLDYLRDHGEGIHHICFGVFDIEIALSHLSEDPAGVFMGGRGRLACFLEETPEGVRIELTGTPQVVSTFVGATDEPGEPAVGDHLGGLVED